MWAWHPAILGLPNDWSFSFGNRAAMYDFVGEYAGLKDFLRYFTGTHSFL